jgi:hypothetical protein
MSKENVVVTVLGDELDVEWACKIQRWVMPLVVGT